MKKNISLLIITLLVAFSVSAQNIKRAYKTLEKRDFEKAIETFQKLLSEDSVNVAANFGMAMIFFDEKSPHHDIIEAYMYIEKVKGKESQLKQDEMVVMGEYFLSIEARKTSRPVKKKVEVAIKNVEASLIKYIREENNLEACYEVLERYPNFKHYDNVVHIRNQFEFRKYEKLHTYEGYGEFIDKFPKAAQVIKAKKYRDSMSFEAVKSKNTLAAYIEYLEKYPDSRYAPKVIKLRNAIAYSNAKKANTMEAYENFVLSYPDALEVPEAKKFLYQLMYEKAKKIKSLEAYNKFIKLYPEGAYYIDVFNLKSADLGKKLTKDLEFSTGNLLWTRAFDNNENQEEAKTIISTADGGYVVAGLTRKADTSFSDAWIIKTDSKGKILWNKSIGQRFNDDVLEVMETSEGKIIVVGYTKLSATPNVQKKGWMFMLGKDGSKIWNKYLGENFITACGIDKNDNVYIAAYNPDTIPDHYFFQTYNEKGSRIAEREYVNQGHFSELLFEKNENVFLVGNKWFTCTNPKFYIKWEDTLKIDAEIKLADSHNNQLIFLASDSLGHYMFKYNEEGKLEWKTEQVSKGSIDKLNDMLALPSGEIIVLGETDTESYAVKYNASGTKVSETVLPAAKGYKFKKADVNNKGEVSCLLSGEDYLVITFTSGGF